MQVGSSVCSTTELDLFSLPPTMTTMERGYDVEYLPLGPLTDEGPIEYYVSSRSDEYINLSKMYLHVKAKITNADGTDLAENAKVAPINNWLHSLFSQVDLSLNGELVTSSNNTYPYRCYLETLLSYGQEAKKSQLQSSLWFVDEPGKFAKTDPAAADTNSALKSRARISGKSKTVDLIGRLHLDVCHQNRLLVNGVDMKLRLNRSGNKFNLMSAAGTEKVTISKAVLRARHVKVNPPTLKLHADSLNKTTMKYPIRRVEVKTFAMTAGTQTITRDNVFLGQLPRRVLVCMTKNSAFVGTKNENPFQFDHNNLNYISIEADGQSFPSQPFTPNFDNENNYIRSYMSLFTETGKIFDDSGNDITRESYRKGFTVWAFDLTPDKEDSCHVHLIKEGNLRLDMKFAEPLGNTTSVFVYAEFDNVIEIDRARNIIKDFK